MSYDAIIIGAGAAGLAAARELSGIGQRICILEARQRIGGRIHTLHVPDLPLPVELGPEFIHGEAHETFAIVEAAALKACELPDRHWWSQGGRWSPVFDFWERIDAVRSQIGTLPRDISFDEFLRTRRNMPRRLRELACRFVEGYHASHADRISARSLAATEEDEDPSANRQFRVLDGYDALVEWLRAGLDPTRVELRLDSPATVIRWRRRHVEVESREETVRGSAALITIPIGVWKAPRDQQGAIGFVPALTDKEKALQKLEIGHVVKLTFRFADRFWDSAAFLTKRSRRKAPATWNFVHSSDRFMPTWWTTAPIRSPMLTGWAGGHAADALLAEGSASAVDRALDSLAAIFDMRRQRLDRQLTATYTHDWQADPFSRGAYAYAGVGGSPAHRALAKPVQETLFFAGEATSAEQTGTVAGAIESGRRAAREMLRVLRAGR